MATNLVYRFGDWSIEPERNRVSKDGDEHHLEAKAMDVLVYLLDHADEVVTKRIEADPDPEAWEPIERGELFVP